MVNPNGTTGANGVSTDNNIGLVRETDIVHEMQGAYLDYAMSVIVSRALPDVRDGLKPVHRRILYAMHHDLGLDHTKPHKKSARIVGEVLGKYHPHGDSAVYDAMVRMAQPFSLRYPLVDGQGNFGSVDGDAAAAMRYTEARLAEISQLMLADLEKDTVDWHDNFDNSLREPDILPAALPNLLINGSSGIAVGMATNIPPHNLGEVVDALVFLIDRYAHVDDITVEELMRFVHGPDFPTGGIVYRYRDEKGEEATDVIAQGYAVGRTRLVVQAKAHFEEMSRSRSRIVVTELPYQTNKAALIERIASLVRDGKIEGITDLRDESDRTGMRMVIELTRNVDPKQVLAELFKYTPLQQTFGMQMLALVDGEPRTLSLKRTLHLFVQHRQEIIRRRSEYDLARAKARAHILEGLLRALDILDEVIATIRRSQSAETARTNLVRGFGFSEIQAQAILDMQLRRLAALERRKLQDEYKEILAQIAYLEDLLAHPEKILGVIKQDLLEIKAKYGDARRTQIVDRTKGTLTTTDLLPDQEVWVTVSANGELRREDSVKPTPAHLRRVAKGSEVALITANTRDFLYLFAKDGRCKRVAIHEIPQSGEDKHLAEMTDFTRRDAITAALALPRQNADGEGGMLFLATAQGMVKRVTLTDFLAAAASDPAVMNVEEKDELRWVLTTRGDQEVMLVSAQGQSIRFAETDVRSMGLAAGGVGGMKLRKGDTIVHAAVVDPAGEMLTITAHGYAKRSALAEYSTQGRNGGGIVTHKPTARTGPVTAALMLSGGEDDAVALAVIPRKGAVQTVALAEIPNMGRSVQGKQVLDLGAGNGVVAVHRLQTAQSATPDPVPPAPNTGPTKPPAAKPPVKPARTSAPAAQPATPKAAAEQAPRAPRRAAPVAKSAVAPVVEPSPTAAQPPAPARHATTSKPAQDTAGATRRAARSDQPVKAQTVEPSPKAAPPPAPKPAAEPAGPVRRAARSTQQVKAPVVEPSPKTGSPPDAPQARTRAPAKSIADAPPTAKASSARRQSDPAADDASLPAAAPAASPTESVQAALLPEDITAAAAAPKSTRSKKLATVTSVKRPKPPA